MRGRCRAAAGLDWAGSAEVALSYFFLKTFLIFYFLFSEIHITFEIIVQIGSNQFEYFCKIQNTHLNTLEPFSLIFYFFIKKINYVIFA